ncbi:MAG: Cna B-type domain-containing protein [Oscillospiraceae bacterium]|nr:Cna B-type domain-containing protein [Oscillospiraceae bacterium]
MMEKQIMELNKRYARKKLLKRIVALLCVFVMLFTVNSLKMVAQTLTRTPMCGLKEHQHKAKCYDASGNLVCGKVEHQHTDACYQESPTLEIEDDSAIGVNNDLALDAGGLSLDLDAGALDLNDDLVTEDVAAPVANEAPVTPTYVLGSKALLSNIIESTGLNIKIKKIKEVGIVDNDGSQVGLVEITKKDNGDYRIKALRDFDQVELAIVLADEVVVVKLLDGVAPAEPVVEEPAAPQVEEAQPAPAVEVEQPEQPAPADESEQPELTVPETEDEQIELAEQPEPAVTEEQANLNVEDAQVEQEEVPAAEEMQIEAPVVEDAQVETPVMEAVEPEQPEAPAVVEEVEPEQPEAPAQEEEAEPTEAPAEEEAAEPEPTEAPVVEEPAEPEQIETPVAEEEPTEVATTEEEPTEVPAGEEPVETSVDEEAVPPQTEASALAGEIEAPAVEEAAAPELADADLTVDVPADEAVATEPTEPEQTVSVEEPEVQIEETAAEETAAGEIATEETATEEKAAEEIASIEEEAVEPAHADEQAEQGDATEEPAPADEQAEQEDATEEPAPAEEQAEQGDAAEDEAAEPALAEAQAPQEDGEEAAEIEGEETAQAEMDELSAAVDAETADGEAGEPEQDEAAVYTAGSREIPVNDAVVTLTWPVEAKIPEDVVITIEEIEKGTEDYDLLYHQALAELPEPDQAVTQVMRFFDITLYTADGQKIEPKAPVSVVVSVNETIDSEVSALHCKEVGAPMETVDANAEGESVAFDAPSFSVYGVNYQVPAEQTSVNSEVTVDLSRVDTMAAATVDGMSVSISIPDLLAGTDDAVESTVDSTVDAEQFVAEATVGSADVTVENGQITLPAEALEKATVSLQLETKETGKDYITTVTTHTVDIVLSDYAGRTEEATGEGVTVKAVGENSLPADAKASVEENVAVPESVEVGENESATAFDINLTNANGDAITGPVAVTVMPTELNVLAELPEGTATEDIQYQLIHIHDDGSTEIVHLPEGAVVVSEDGKVESFSFETESFSTYVFKYTVDFEYTDPETGKTFTWSWGGRGSYPVADILARIGVEGEISDVSLVRTVDAGGSSKALYLSEDKTELISEEAFQDTFELTVVVDGVSYVIVVTDDVTWEGHTFTSLASLIDTGSGEKITVNFREGTNNTVQGNTSTSEMTLHADIAYTIRNKISQLNQLVTDALASSDKNVYLDYDMTALINAHENLSQITGSGELYKGGDVMGEFTVTDGHVLVRLDATKLDTQATSFEGTFDLKMIVSTTTTTISGNETFDFPGTSDTLTIVWPAHQHGHGTKTVDTNNTAIYTAEDDGYLYYNYTLTIDGGLDLTNLKLSDTLPEGMELDGNVTITRNTTTHNQQSTRNKYDDTTYGVWGAWSDTSTDTSTTTRSATPTVADGVMSLDVGSAVGLDSVSNITENDTTRTRSYTQSTYTLTYRTRILKSVALSQMSQWQNSTQLTNTAKWNEDTTEIPGGSVTVTINKQEMTPGHKVVDGNNSNNIQIAYLDMVDEGGTKYAQIDYIVSISEPIDATSAVLTDKLSEHQKLKNTSAELFIDDENKGNVTFGSTGAMGETISFDLQAALQALSPQESFTHGKTYKVKYSTLVPYDVFNTNNGATITNETDWTINNTGVPGEDKTVVVTRKPYEPNYKTDLLGNDTTVSGDGPWTIPWQITTQQVQDATNAKLIDKFSVDQTLKYDSFKLYIGGTDYTIPSSYIVYDEYASNDEYHKFTIDIDAVIKAVTGDNSDPAFKANTEYKITYETTTEQYDVPATSEHEQSKNLSRWEFDGYDIDYAGDYVTLKKLEYKPGEKSVANKNHDGVWYQDRIPAYDTGHLTTPCWATVEPELIAASSHDQNKLLLHYRIRLEEPFGYPDITKAVLTDTYDSRETLNVGSFKLKVNTTDGDGTTVDSNYITHDSGNHTFTIDMVDVVKNLSGADFAANTRYYLEYSTTIELTDKIKALLKTQDGDQLVGFTVKNQQAWHFEGTPGTENKPGNETTYTFMEKPYNGGDKSVAVYDTASGELINTSTGTGKTVITVDNKDNTLKYTISLTESRNTSKAVLHDEYSAGQTLKQDSFKVSFQHEGQTVTLDINTDNGLTLNDNNTFDIDLTQVLSDKGYTFTKNVTYNISYEATVNKIGEPGSGATSTDTSNGRYQNHAGWTFDDGNGTGEGGDTDIHLEESTYTPGSKAVKVVEEVGHADYWNSDWATLDEPENYGDNTARISSVFDGETYHLNYSIIIEEAKPVTTAVLTDTFQGSANQTLVPGSFTLSIDGSDPISIPDSYVDFTHPTTGFTLRLTDFLASKSLSFQKNTEYEIGFQTTTTTKNNTSINGDGADNKAEWTFDDEATVDGGHTETHLKVVPKVEKTYYNAAGEEHGEVNFGERVKYVITIGSADDVLNGYWYTDDMTCYHHFDQETGIIVKRGETELATLGHNKTTPNGWTFQCNGANTWNSDSTYQAFYLAFPTKQNNNDSDFMGPITLEYYVDVGTQQQTGIVGLKDVLNTVKSTDTEITTKFQLSSGTVELDKIALPIEDDTLENDNVIAWWRVNLTPVEMSLQNLYLKDFDARFSTVSAENAASGTGTTGMTVGTTPGTTYHVYYTNAGTGHAADDPVPGNLYTLDNGNLKFTGDIQEPVYVTFATLCNPNGTYKGGSIYLTNSARLTDSNDKTVGGPDTATKEYTEEGTITATKTFKDYTRDNDGKATINWQFEIKATGTASVYGYTLREEVYRYSHDQANVQDGNYLTFDFNAYDGLVITDANGVTLVKGADYTVDYFGIHFLKRSPCPITVVVPMTIGSLPSGTTYLYNKAVLKDRDGNPTDVEGTGTITDWTIKVDKTIENNGQKPIAPNFDQSVTYKIVANSARDPLPAGTTIVTDILPAGMEYVDDSVYFIFTNSNTSLRCVGEWERPIIRNALKPTVGTTVINGTTHQTLTFDFSKATEAVFVEQGGPEIIDYFDSTDTSTYSLNLNGASVEIGYEAKLTDAEILRLQNLGTNVPQIYNNTVTVTQGDDASGSDDVEWDYTWNNGLKKEDITDAHYAQMASKPPILWYKVSINPDARTMNNGNNLIMVDKIPTAMELNLGTVEVKDANGDVVSEAKVSYDGITRELTVRVPDGKACYVTFNATIENPKLDEAVSYTNSVKLKGESTWTDTVTETHTVTTLSGTVDYTIDRGFFIEKVDGNNITLKLPGAEFTLYKASFPALSYLEQVYTDYANYENDKDSVNYDLTPFVLNPDDDTHPVVKTADTNGRVSFEHLDIGHLYYWVETKTPDDTYSAGMFAEPQYVILYQTSNKIVEPESYAHAKLLDHLISDANGIIVNTAKENYVWTATNFKETQYSVKKTWQDNDNAQRPQFIYVQLLRDGEPYDDPGTPANDGLVRIEADNLGEWEYTWFDLPAKRDGGADYVYSAYELTPEQMQTAGLITAEEQTALESRLDGYVTIYNRTSGGVEIINRKGDETSMLIEKAWEDEDNVSLLRPGFITVKLYRETLNGPEAGTVVQVAPSLTNATTIEEATRSIRIYANDNWKKEIVGLETNNGAGINYRYYIQEDDVNNYITTYQTPISLAGGEAGGLADTDGVVRITNKLDAVQVTKRWLDAEGQEAWPADVTFKLVKRDAEGVYRSVDTPIYYSSRGEAWSDEITTTTDNRKAIWLHLDPLGENEAYFAVEYAIAGVDESAIVRDSSVTVETGLKQPALSFTMNGVHYDVTGGTSSTGTGIVVNAPRTSVDFAKQWFNASETANADNNPDNLKIRVQLRRYSSIDGQEDTTFALRDQVFELDKEGNMQTEGDITFYDKGDWTAQWTNLPLTGWVNGESEVYQYRVTETAVVNTATNSDVAGYIAVQDKDYRAIRNYYPDQEISVSKVWLPEPDGAWSITAKLQVAQRLVERSGLRDEDAPWSEFADYDPEGEEATQTVTIGVDADGDLISGTTYDSATGKYTSKVTLPKYRYVELTNSLYELKFTAVEETTALAELGYILIDTVTEGNETTFTNESQNMVVTVEKKWEPKPDPTDNPSVTVQLKRYMMPLPQTEATVTKVWDDDNDRDGIRPSSLTVTLSNGQTVTLNDGNSWTGTINDLPMYENEEPVTYTWSEGTVSGYTQSSAALAGTTTTLTNSHTPERVSASIALVWDDENDKDGIRPASVTATLSNGQTVELSASNSWAATISDLPKYESGSEITYSWSVVDVSDYVKQSENYSRDASLTLYHEPSAEMITVKAYHFQTFDNPSNMKEDVNTQFSAGTTIVIRYTTQGFDSKLYINHNEVTTFSGAGLHEYEYKLPSSGEVIIHATDPWYPGGITDTISVTEKVAQTNKASVPKMLSTRKSMSKAPAMQLMGSTPVVTHTDALPATAPTDYVEDASFTAENITLTLNDTLGWKRSFAQQPKLDFLGRPYYYFVEEISYTPSEDYWIDNYSGDPLNTSGTITVTNKKAVSSVKVTKAFSGIDELPSGFQITNSFNSTVFSVANKTAGNGTAASPYEWVINDVPVGTTVTFTESGFGVDNYDLTVNGTAITTQANVTATATSAEGTVNEAPFSNVYTPKLGALKLKKLVTVDSAATTTTLADGAYTFTIHRSEDGETTTDDKTVVITITNGVAASATVDDNTVSLTDDKFVVIGGLIPGDYVITEEEVTGMTVTSITGGKLTEQTVAEETINKNDADLEARTVTVTVTAGDTAAATAASQATYTNNKVTTSSIGLGKVVTVDGHAPNNATEKSYVDGNYTFKLVGEKAGAENVEYTIVITIADGVMDHATINDGATIKTVNSSEFVPITTNGSEQQIIKIEGLDKTYTYTLSEERPGNGTEISNIQSHGLSTKPWVVNFGTGMDVETIPNVTGIDSFYPNGSEPIGNYSAVFTNNYDTGELYLKKEIAAENALLGKTDGIYKFRLKNRDGNTTGGTNGALTVDKLIEITLENGAMTSGTIRDYDAAVSAATSLTLDDKYGYKVDGLPLGLYTISEESWTLAEGVFDKNYDIDLQGAQAWMVSSSGEQIEPAIGGTDEKTNSLLVKVSNNKLGVANFTPADYKTQAVFTNRLDDITLIPKKTVWDYNDSEGEESIYALSEKTFNDSADHDAGDQIPYRVYSFIPEVYKERNVYPYEIVDVMERLELVTGSPRVYFVMFNDEDKKSHYYDVTSKFTIGGPHPTTAEEASHCYSDVATARDDKWQTFTASIDNVWTILNNDTDVFNELKWNYEEPNRQDYPKEDEKHLVNNGYKFKDHQDRDTLTRIELRYKATFNGPHFGAHGNLNDVYINYDSGDYAKTSKPDRNRVFTYKLELNKVDDQGNKLENAQFTLEKKVRLNSGNGEVEGTDYQWVTVPQKSGTAGDVFIWEAIDDGAYRLTETAPAGYVRVDPIVFSVSAEHEFDNENPALTSLKVDAASGIQSYFTNVTFEANQVKGTVAIADEAIKMTVPNVKLIEVPVTKHWAGAATAEKGKWILYKLTRRIGEKQDSDFNNRHYVCVYKDSKPDPASLETNANEYVEYSNSWNYTWSDLPRAGTIGNVNGEYTYEAHEIQFKYGNYDIIVTSDLLSNPADVWTVTQDGNAITNTLASVNIEVNKAWAPVVTWPSGVESVTVQLQKAEKVFNEEDEVWEYDEFEDVSNKTLTITAENNVVTAKTVEQAQGSEKAAKQELLDQRFFYNLPKYDIYGNEIKYRVVETAVTGTNASLADFTVSYNPVETTTGGVITVTNTVKPISLKVVKLAKGTTTRLSGAQFQLTRKLSGEETFTRFKHDSFGDYVDTSGQIHSNKGPFTVSAEGITLNGLLPGVYKLQETKSPTGYIITAKVVEFTLNADGTVTVTGGTDDNEGKITLSGNDMVTFTQKSDSAAAEVDVQNEPGAALPATGGSGVTLYYVAGSALLLLALGMLLLRRKRNYD